jgi:hypothetical protein
MHSTPCRRSNIASQKCIPCDVDYLKESGWFVLPDLGHLTLRRLGSDDLSSWQRAPPDFSVHPHALEIPAESGSVAQFVTVMLSSKRQNGYWG